MQKILFFVESLSCGGAEKALVTLLSHLDASKYDITLLTLVNTGPLKDDINPKKIRYKSVIRPSSNLFISFWNKVKYVMLYHYLPVRGAYRWIIPQKDFDIYVAFTEGYATKLLAFAPGKKVTWVHTDLINNPWPLKIGIYKDFEEEKSTYSNYDNVVCVSHIVESIMRSHYGIHNTQTIYNLIDRENIILLSKVSVETAILPGFNIVTVGRLVQEKGYDKLIPIIAGLQKERSDIHLYIIGTGPEEDKLKQIAYENGVINNVFFVGYQNNPYPLMRQSDLMVCASRAEGFGLTIAEAMILELPIISMKCAGTSELLRDGQFGELCDSYESLTSAISRALQDTTYLHELRSKVSKGKTQFDIRQSIQQVEILFDSIWIN